MYMVEREGVIDDEIAEDVCFLPVLVLSVSISVSSSSRRKVDVFRRICDAGLNCLDDKDSRPGDRCREANGARSGHCLRHDHNLPHLLIPNALELAVTDLSADLHVDV